MELRAEEQQIYYEISMSIGCGLDHTVMLKQVLGKYLRKLNLSAGCILRRVDAGEGAVSFEAIYQLPKLAAVNRAIQIVDAYFEKRYAAGEAEAFEATLPFSIATGLDESAHVFRLPDFGVLVLVKSGGELDQRSVRSLGPLNDKLSLSLIASLHKVALAKSEESLAKANEQLAQLDSDKLAFIQYLCHELNTPLNWIGSLDLIDTNSLGWDSLRCLDFVRKGFTRISALTQHATSYFEEARRMTPRLKEPVELCQVANLLKSRFQQESSAKELALVLEGDWGDALTVDKPGLEFVLAVLLDNAIGFSEWGREVRVGFERKAGVLAFHVIDRGVGIDPVDLLAVFKPFQIPEHKRREGGTGFSLPRAYLICLANGWALSAKSEGAGRGAHFTLSL